MRQKAQLTGFVLQFSFWLLLSSLLLGCSQASLRRREKNAIPRDTLVKSYLLFNEQRRVLPPERSGAGAVGVFLKAPEEGDRTECTCTHLSFGVVATNAHCAKDYLILPTSDFFVVFFDRETGQMVQTPIQSFIRVGDERIDDMAFFKISDETADRWENLGVTLEEGYQKYSPAPTENNPKDWKTEVPHVQKVTVYSYDPLATHAEFDTFFRSRIGGIFSTKTCTMTRTVPWVAEGMIAGGPSGAKKLLAANKLLHPEMHLFFDRCDRSTVDGNSGSAVFSESGQLIGFFHWNLKTRDFEKGEFYLNTLRNWIDVWLPNPTQKSWTAVLNVGSVFDYLLNVRFSLLKDYIRKG